MSAHNKHPGLFDTALALESMLVTLIDAGVFEQLPTVSQEARRLECEPHAAIDLGVVRNRLVGVVPPSLPSSCEPPSPSSVRSSRCTNHDDAKRTAAQALSERRRPSSTIPRGLYDTARDWPGMGVVIGDCPRCRSTLTLTLHASEHV